LIEPLSGRAIGGTGLRIATCWTRAERQEIEHEYRSQIAESGPIRLIWVEMPVETPLARMGLRLPPVDVVLGGPVTEYARLAQAGMLVRLRQDGSAFWRVARRSVVEPSEVPAEMADRPALDDPRVSPATLSWADGLLRSGSWNNGYASLVRLFGHAAARPGWTCGSNLPASQHGRGWTLAAGRSRRGSPPGLPAGFGGVVYEEGAAILLGTRHLATAQGFLAFLASRPLITEGASASATEPDATELLADLLGATLIDAQDELLAAYELLETCGPDIQERALHWLTEPPAWPPASIEKLQTRGSDSALAMMQDLAGQIAPDSELRFWLVQSWLRPRRTFDQSVLSELSRAVQGRLSREPRFRAWLRGEWTAWARQRYRRVARLVAPSGAPPPGAPSPVAAP
jgi:hypothetical protein